MVYVWSTSHAATFESLDDAAKAGRSTSRHPRRVGTSYAKEAAAAAPPTASVERHPYASAKRCQSNAKNGKPSVAHPLNPIAAPV